MEKKAVVTIVTITLICVALFAALGLAIMKFIVPLFGKGEPAGLLDPAGGVVATVNGQNIEGWQYDYQKHNVAAYFTANGYELDDETGALVEQYAFEGVLANETLRQEAVLRGITVTDEEVKARLDEAIAYDFDTPEAYAEWMAAEGITDQQIFDLFKVNVMSEKLYDLISSETVITDDELKTAYDADPSAYDSVKTSHILILFNAAADTPTEEEKKTAYDRCMAVLTELNKDPSRFAELAIQYSEDGSAPAGGVFDLTFTAQATDVFPEYVAGAFSLSGVGDYSKEPVESTAGYHIIKIDEETKGFDANKETVRTALIAGRMEDAFYGYLETKQTEAVIDRFVNFIFWSEGNDLYQ